MAPMLPAPSIPTRSLADIAGQCVGQLLHPVAATGEPIDKLTLVVVDGLGADLIKQHSGHARFLSRSLATHGEVVSSGLPSTTAAALASITTAAHAGEHGLLGYQVRDPRSGRVVNHLKPYPDLVTPEIWQPVDTIFQRATVAGCATMVVGETRFAGTDFSESILRGGHFVGSYSLDEHLQAYRSFWDQNDRGLAYLYWPTLDRLGHSHGVDSDAWRDELERIDAFVEQLVDLMGPGEHVMVLADHGMVDVNPADRFVLHQAHPLRSAIAVWAGEPRLVHLYLHDPSESSVVATELADVVGSRATVLDRTECLHRGLFGRVTPGHEGRIGDVVVLAEGRAAFYDEATVRAQSLAMIGQHGSWSPAEMRVPALLFSQ